MQDKFQLLLKLNQPTFQEVTIIFSGPLGAISKFKFFLSQGPESNIKFENLQVMNVICLWTQGAILNSKILKRW